MGEEKGMYGHDGRFECAARAGARLLPAPRIRALQDAKGLPQDALSQTCLGCDSDTNGGEHAGKIYRNTIEWMYGRKDHGGRVPGASGITLSHPAIPARR